MSNDIQITLFSATMPSILYQLTDKFMRNPIKIIVKNEQLTLEGIKQYYINLDDDSQKYEQYCNRWIKFAKGSGHVSLYNLNNPDVIIHKIHNVYIIHTGIAD